MKKHSRIALFFENEGGGTDASELTLEAASDAKKSDIPPTQNQLNQAQIDTKKGAFLDAQKKVISLGSSLENIANAKVDAVLSTPLYDSLPPDERRKKIQEIVNEFMTEYKAEYDALKANLEAVVPSLPKEEIELQLQDAESQAFEIFINNKRKENIEKRKEQRKQRFLKSIVPTQDEQKDKKNQELVGKFEADYVAIRTKILEQHPELGENKAELKREIQKAIDAEFVVYCSQNGIEVDTEILTKDEISVQGVSDGLDSEDGDQYIRIESRGSIIQAQNEYVAAARNLTNTVQTYQEEVKKYDKVQTLERQESVVYDLPKKIVDLPPGESSSFLGTTGGSEVVYEATREPDGEYTLTFNGHTMKNLPKNEVEVIVDLNAVPVINSIFTANSGLYHTLLKEYKLICQMGGSDPLENPPLGFIDFLYNRLNDAYLATMPEESNSSLLGFTIADMPFKERGKYIRNVLSTNIEIRNEVMKRLEVQKIIVAGKINLSRYPR